MRALNPGEIPELRGCAAWEQVGVGLGAIGLGLTIASGPIGVFGMAAAMGLSCFGGIAIGDAFSGGGAFF